MRDLHPQKRSASRCRPPHHETRCGFGREVQRITPSRRNGTARGPKGCWAHLQLASLKARAGHRKGLFGGRRSRPEDSVVDLCAVLDPRRHPSNCGKPAKVDVVAVPDRCLGQTTRRSLRAGRSISPKPEHCIENARLQRHPETTPDPQLRSSFHTWHGRCGIFKGWAADVAETTPRDAPCRFKLDRDRSLLRCWRHEPWRSPRWPDGRPRC